MFPKLTRQRKIVPLWHKWHYIVFLDPHCVHNCIAIWLVHVHVYSIFVIFRVFISMKFVDSHHRLTAKPNVQELTVAIGSDSMLLSLKSTKIWILLFWVFFLHFEYWFILCCFVSEINCGWPGPFYNGYLIGHKTTVGATIFFR